jgi:hypothetical protein
MPNVKIKASENGPYVVEIDGGNLKLSVVQMLR